VSVFADGVGGHAECVADVDPFYLPETNDTALHVLRDFLVPMALGLEIAGPRDVLPALARVRGHEMAKAALEMAVWELWARRDGVPLWRLLGGRRGEIEAGVSVGLQKDEDALLAKVEAEVAAGYRRVKVKIKPGRDVALVAAVRARFPRLPLMVDANSAYTLADADRLVELDRFNLTMIEQPLAWDDIVDHATLQRRLATPLCLDESIRSGEDARRALELGACRVVNAKVGRVGGFAGALAVHDVCRARGAPVWCGGMLESGIAVSPTCTCRRSPASPYPATRRRAPATSRRISWTRRSRCRRRAGSRCPRDPASATRSCGRASSGRPTSTRPGSGRRLEPGLRGAAHPPRVTSR
jgi:O-succinylbenzoate synthase